MALTSEHIRSGEQLPDTAALLQKRSASNIAEGPIPGEKIRENKIYTTRDDQIYYNSNKVLHNVDPLAKTAMDFRRATSTDFAGAFSKKNASRFINRNSNDHERQSLPSYLRLHEQDSKFKSANHVCS